MHLEGLKVIDFGQGVAGPYGAMLLGDFGADVIKIEPPRGDWCRQFGAKVAAGSSTVFLPNNRNKRGICLDLNNDAGRSIALALVCRSDVIIQSFRPGVMERFGLGYDDVKHLNPKAIYCSVSGFGDDGPYRDRPAGDSTMQAFAGLMSIIGEETGPPLRVGNVVVDMIAGMHVFEACLLAMIRRLTKGCGAHVKINLLDAMLAFQSGPITQYLVTGDLPERLGNNHPMASPSGLLATRGAPVVFTVLHHQWIKFCAAIDRPDLSIDPRFGSAENRLTHRVDLMRMLQEHFLSVAEEVVHSWLTAADVLFSPVNDYAALIADPQVQHNGSIQFRLADGGIKLPFLKNPIVIDKPAEIRHVPPALGEHTREVLRDELALSDDDVTRLEDIKAIYCASTKEAR